MVSSASANKPLYTSPFLSSTVTTWFFPSCNSLIGTPLAANMRTVLREQEQMHASTLVLTICGHDSSSNDHNYWTTSNVCAHCRPPPNSQCTETHRKGLLNIRFAIFDTMCSKANFNRFYLSTAAATQQAANICTDFGNHLYHSEQ